MRRIRLLLIAAIIICCATGLAIKMGIVYGHFKFYSFIYFTNLSNILALCIYLADIFGVNKKSKAFIYFKGLSLVNIIITGIIFYTVLSPSGFNMSSFPNSEELGSLLLHMAAPLLTVADWLFFENKGVFAYKLPFIWYGFPVLYFFFTVFQAKLGGFIPNQLTKYPYNFIAVDILGWKQVLGNALFISMFYILLGYIIVFLDKYIGKRGAHNEK